MTISGVVLIGACPNCGHAIAEHGRGGCNVWVGNACTSPCSCSLRVTR